MTVKALDARSIQQINLSLHTQFFPLTLKALVRQTRDQFNDVRALTKISFMGDCFTPIAEPRPLRTSVLVPSVLSNAYVVIVRFDVFLRSQEQYDAYLRLNGIEGHPAADPFAYVMKQNEASISNLSIPELLASAQPLQLALCVHFSAESAMAPSDSVEFVRRLIMTQTADLALTLQRCMFDVTFEQVETLMYGCAEKFDDAFERLNEQQGIQMPFHDILFQDDDFELFALGKVDWGKQTTELKGVAREMQHYVPEPSVSDSVSYSHSHSQQHQQTVKQARQLASPVSAQVSQYTYGTQALQFRQDDDMEELPLTLFTVRSELVSYYQKAMAQMNERAFYFQQRFDPATNATEFVNLRFSERHNAANALVFSPSFLPSLVQFLKESAFNVVILGPPAASNLVGRTCQCLISPKLRQCVLFSRNVARRPECAQRGRFRAYEEPEKPFSLWEQLRGALEPKSGPGAAQSDFQPLERCQYCGRIAHDNYVFPGASIQCVSGDFASFASVSSPNGPLYVVDLCDASEPFKVIGAKTSVWRPEKTLEKAPPSLARECAQLRRQLLLAQIAGGQDDAEIAVVRARAHRFEFVEPPPDAEEAEKQLSYRRRQHCSWAAKLIGQ